MTASPEKIALLTDTTCDIPRALLEKYHIYRLPQYVIWGDEVLNDLTDITLDDFYERLAVDPIHPKTSKTNPTDVEAAIRTIRAAGAEEIFGIFVTGALSGTIDTIKMVADQSEIPFEVYDSRSVSIGLGAQVLAAAEAREKGGDRQAMRQAADWVRRAYRANLSLATLHYVHKGGRLSKTMTLIGTALQIKPSLFLNHETGTIDLGRKVRTRKKALEAILELTFAGLDLTKKLRFAVAHGQALAEANAFIREIRERCDPFELMLTQISPAVGVHAGPGVVGIGVYADEW